MKNFLLLLFSSSDWSLYIVFNGLVYKVWQNSTRSCACRGIVTGVHRMQYDPLKTTCTCILHCGKRLLFSTLECLKWILFGVRHRDSGMYTKLFLIKLLISVAHLLTSKVSGDKIAEGSFAFPAGSLAVSFLTPLRSGTW